MLLKASFHRIKKSPADTVTAIWSRTCSKSTAFTGI